MFKIPDQKGTPEQPPQTPRARGARGGGIWGNTSGRFISVLKCYNLFRIAIFYDMSLKRLKSYNG